MEKITTTKEKSLELRFAQSAPKVWEALGNLPRTGWVNRGVKNPESVQDHIVNLRRLAFSIEGLSEDEKDGLLDMLEIHDWPEAIHGDEVIITENVRERESLKAIKFEKEQKALEKICADLGDRGTEIIQLWLRFENSNDTAASFARQLDKYQAIEKALEFEKEQDIALFKEFLEYSRKYISHPILIERMNMLEAEWQELQK